MYQELVFMDKLQEFNLDYVRLTRTRDNLKKNFDRRKKLNLLEDSDERQLKEDIRKLDLEISSIQRQIRSIESQNLRSKIIKDSK